MNWGVLYVEFAKFIFRLALQSKSEIISTISPVMQGSDLSI